MKTVIMIVILMNPFADADQNPGYYIFKATTVQECMNELPSAIDLSKQENPGMMAKGACVPFDFSKERQSYF